MTTLTTGAVKALYTFAPSTVWGVTDSAANLLAANGHASTVADKIALNMASSITVSAVAGTEVTVAQARTLFGLAGGNVTLATGAPFKIKDTALNILDASARGVLLQATALDVSEASVADTIKVEGLASYMGLSGANLKIELKDTASAIEAAITNDVKSLIGATSIKVTATLAEMADLATAIGTVTFTTPNPTKTITLQDTVAHLSDATMSTDDQTLAQTAGAVKISDATTFSMAQAAGLKTNLAGLIAANSLDVVDTLAHLTGDDATTDAIGVTKTATANDASGISATNWHAAYAKFTTKLVAHAVTDTAANLATLTADELAKASAATYSYSATGDDLVSVANAKKLLTAGATATGSGKLTLNDTTDNILAATADAALTAAAGVKISGGAAVTVEQALKLVTGKANMAFDDNITLAITDTAANLLAVKANAKLVALGGYDSLVITISGANTVSAADAGDLVGLFGLTDAPTLANGATLVVSDTAAHLLDDNLMTDGVTGLATSYEIKGANEGTVANAKDLKTLTATLGDGATLVVTTADMAAVNTRKADLTAAAALVSEIELTSLGTAAIEAADYVASNAIYKKIGLASGDPLNLTIKLTGSSTTTLGTTASGASAGDGDIVNVGTIDASGNGAAVTLNLGAQGEGFVIKGVSDYANTITGGQGADSITGGTKSDTFIGFSLGDTVDGGETTVTGGDITNSITDQLVLAATSAGLNAATDDQLVHVEKVAVTGASAAVTIDLSKQTEGFIIAGASGQANTIKAGGSLGDTVADTKDTENSITGGSAADAITGGVSRDIINGYTAGDSINGGGGRDTIVLTVAGSDTLLGAAADTLITAVEEIDASGLTGGATLNLTKQTEAFKIIGGSGDDKITAGGGNDTIVGFAGTDTVDGGGGSNTLVLNNTTAATYTFTTTTLAKVQTIDATLATAAVTLVMSGLTSGEIVKASNNGDTITGTTGADKITGGSGNDTINGFAGADTVDGGAGTGDRLVLTATSTDLNSALDTQLVNVESVTVSGNTAVTLSLTNQNEGFTITGGGGADVITGGKGADTITGGAGNDTINGFTTGDIIDGGDGTDTLVLTASLSTATTNDQIAHLENVSVASTVAAGIIIYLGSQLSTESFSITGGSGADTITGGAGNDTISGGGGDDKIIGFTTGDAVDGGAVIDTLVLSGASASYTIGDTKLTTVEIFDASTATSAVTLDLSAQTESLIIKASNYGDTITGGTVGDKITGGNLADKIIGFTTGDTVDGGGGADILSLSATSTALNAALDTQLVNVETVTASAAATISLTNQTEGLNIEGSTGADAITGGKGADTITGGAGNDVLNGGAGNDTFNGFVGADTITGGDGTDTLVLSADLSAADDTRLLTVEVVTAAAASAAVTINLTSQTEALTIIGASAKANTITGGGGNDTISVGTVGSSIVGGAGNDTITGGATAGNTFVYTTLADSVVATYDTIADFKSTDKFQVAAAKKTAIDGGALSNVAATATGTATLTQALTSALTSTNFVANAAAVVTFTCAGAGRYLVINDGTAGFNDADAVVKLSTTAAVTKDNFIA